MEKVQLLIGAVLLVAIYFEDDGQWKEVHEGVACHVVEQRVPDVAAEIAHAQVVVICVRVNHEKEAVDKNTADTAAEHHPVLLPQRFESFLLQTAEEHPKSQQQEAVYYG